MKKYLKILVLLAIVVLLLAMNHYFGWSNAFANGEITDTLSSMISVHPVQAAILYCIVSFIGCVVLALPGVIFAISAGLIFGPVWGTILCWISMSFGASVSFLVGRFFLQDAIKPKLKKQPLLNRFLFEETEKSDVYLLAITRLVPLFPFNLQNFAYGITDIKFSRYCIFTALFILPGTAAYTIAAAGVVNSDQRLACLVIASVLIAGTLLVAKVIKGKANIQ